MEQLMWAYGYGRPLVDGTGDGQIPIHITIAF
jgi:hypothetical protein